jgi:hypothetical protein
MVLLVIPIAILPFVVPPTMSRTLLAQDLETRISAAVERVTPAIVEPRHQIHANPELGNRDG